MKTSKELADEHYKYVDGLLRIVYPEITQTLLDIVEYVYKSTFIHGYKHGQEDKR